MNLKSLKLILLIMLVAIAGPARAERYQKMAMYISADKPEAITAPQEKAAAELFKNTFSKDGKFITPSQIGSISVANYDCIWVHIDRIGVGQNVESFPCEYRRPDFIAALKKFHEDGGNLYLSKAAVQLLFSAGIGRLEDYLRPNVFSDGKDVSGVDIWSINATIGARTPSSHYYDQSTHQIYRGLETMKSNEWTLVKDPAYEDYVYNVFPMQGDRGKASINREDHNCMWRVAQKDANSMRIGICVGSYKENDVPVVINGGPVQNIPVEQIGKINVFEERQPLQWLWDYKNGILDNRLIPGAEIEVVTPADIKDRINSNYFDCLWIHIDRKDIGRGNLPAEFSNPDFIELLGTYVRNGGNLLLTKQATQLVSLIGRVDSRFAPNIYGDGNGGRGKDVWTVNAHIGVGVAPSYDHRTHPIYAGLRTAPSFNHETFGLEGTGDGKEMHRMDHNCMWDLNAYAYNVDGPNVVAKFEKENDATVLGTWGQETGYANAGIVEFNPTAAFRGRIIANGLAAYEWNTDGNAYHDNIMRLTENCFKYLNRVHDYNFKNDGDNGIVRLQADAKATVLGTWGQDWDHQAAGIVEFHPTRQYPANQPDANGMLDQVDYTNKAPKGSVVANGIACVQLYHEAGNNHFQNNANRLTTNIVDYLSPWHEMINTGIENVSADGQGSLRATGGAIAYAGFERPTLLSVFAADGRMIYSAEIAGEGTVELPCRGIVVAVAGARSYKFVF